MLENLSSAIEITLIGMSLVFAAILLFWGVMVAMIRILEEKKAPSTIPSSKEEKIILLDNLKTERRLRAAVIAVACALEQNRHIPREFPLPPTAIVSAWQAVARSNMLRRGRVR